ncbi:MAG: glycosyltransferase, partial [Alphaproteobacteria bacterium]
DLQGADWGGIIAERQDEKEGVHPHYPENKKPYVYMPGFMVIDTKLWREKKMWDKFVEIIKTYGERLKFFDLDILNLAADKIYPVPFEYCVLENIYDEMDKAPEYPWLERAQGKDALLKAQKNPIIIHYAGRNPKVWKRSKEEIPGYYWVYVEKSPFYDKEFYFPGWRTKIKLPFLWFMIKICPIKKLKKKLKDVYFLGRLGDYKYYDMDKAIVRSFELFSHLKGNR